MPNEINSQLIQHGSRSALACCSQARQLEDSGDYEGARKALEIFWLRVGEWPRVEGLDDYSKAEVLLRVGVLTGRLGGVYQIEGAQQLAADIIGASQRIFEGLGLVNRILEGYISVATCFDREGQFDNARALLKTVLEQVDDDDLKARALLRLAIVEEDASMLHDASKIHEQSRAFFESLNNHALRGMHHHEYGIILKKLALADKNEKYYDAALLEFAAATYHYEKSNHLRYCAAVENNIGNIQRELGRYDEAHKHVAKAQNLAYRLKDKSFLANFHDTRALIYTDEGRYSEAIHYSTESVNLHAAGDHKALLAESLITQGIALARGNQVKRGKDALERAARIAQEIEDKALELRASVALTNELPASHWDVRCRALQASISLLHGCQDASLFTQVSESAARLFELWLEMRGKEQSTATPNVPDWEGFSLKDEVRKYEAQLIELAMKASGGSVRKAAKLLGLKYHQTLDSKLNGNHQDLKTLKTQPAPGRSYTTFKSAETPKAQPAKRGKRVRIYMNNNSLCGLGVYAGMWVVAERGEVKQGDLVAVKVQEGFAVGYYQVEDGVVYLEVPSFEYEDHQIHKDEILEIVGPVIGWHKSDDFNGMTPI